MIDPQRLPHPLPAADIARLEEQLAYLATTHSGNGCIGMWSSDTSQLFLAVVEAGELRGWVMVPATSEEAAKRLALPIYQVVLEQSLDAAERAARAADAAIARATLH